MYCPSCIPTKAGSVCDFYPVSGNFNDALIDLLTVDAANNLYRIKMINHNLYLTPASNSSGAALTWENASNADNQIWQLCASQSSGGGSTGGSTTITMPVNANQNYSGNSSWIINYLADNYTEEVAMQINGILHDLQGGTTELEKLQQKLADSQQEFDRLLDMSLECDASFLDEKLKHASEEIDNLQKQVDQLTASQQKAANPNLQLTDSDFRITEYSDTLVARIIERIEVISAVRIKIEFIGGYTVTVPLQS